jgi:hypothetical protein
LIILDGSSSAPPAFYDEMEMIVVGFYPWNWRQEKRNTEYGCVFLFFYSTTDNL